MKTPMVRESQDGTVLTVHIQPKASRTECVGPHGDALKIRVAAPPVDGVANEELIRFLAQSLDVPLSAVRIEAGGSGRRKRMKIMGVTASFVLSRLNQDGRSTKAR
jgi:uncharacterized protein (TIGR00251 family)